MEARTRDVKIWVKLFVGFHLLAIFSWSLPNPPNAVKNGIAPPVGSDVILYYNDKYIRNSPFPDKIPTYAWPVSAYVLTTGTWQSWDMFAPNPSNTDVWCHVEIVRENGKVDRYAYPRIYDMPIPKKYVMERWRKFYERVNQNQYQFLWPTFAQRIAHICDTDPSNRPVKVRLFRHFKRVETLEPAPWTKGGEALSKYFFSTPLKRPSRNDVYEVAMFREQLVDRSQLDEDRK